MTLDDWGNLGEIVGSIAVVVSLLYLATQIRQNSRLVRSASLQSQAQVGIAALGLIAQNVETANVFTRGLRDAGSLEPGEQTQFFAILGMVFLGFQHSLYLQRDGLLDDDMWRRQASIARWYLSNPGVQTWWLGFARDRILSRDFVAWAEAEGYAPQPPSDPPAAPA